MADGVQQVPTAMADSDSDLDPNIGDRVPPAADAATLGDVRQLMAMMAQQNQVFINLTAQRQPDPRSDGSPTMRGSPLSKAIDMRGSLKCEEFDGNKENFQSWKRAFYSTIDLLNPAWAVRCKRSRKRSTKQCPSRV